MTTGVRDPSSSTHAMDAMEERATGEVARDQVKGFGASRPHGGAAHDARGAPRWIGRLIPGLVPLTFVAVAVAGRSGEYPALLAFAAGALAFLSLLSWIGTPAHAPIWPTLAVAIAGTFAIVTLLGWLHRTFPDGGTENPTPTTALRLAPLAANRQLIVGARLETLSLRGLDLTSSTLWDASFDMSDLRGAVFDRSVLINVSFAGACLRGASFIGADLVGVTFEHADLSGALLDPEDAGLVGEIPSTSACRGAP